jgi:2'-5' RNA ligase
MPLRYCLLREGPVLPTAWHHEELARPRPHLAVAQADGQPELEHQEGVVGVGVPVELTLGLDHQDVDEPAPLILTVELDPALFAVLDSLRTAHFPPERNLVPAHITLFHALPGAEVGRIADDLAACAAASAPLPLALPAVRFLGRGVALEVVSPGLVALRRSLAQTWAPWLSRQDQQNYRPHVTIQNKVSPEMARRLYDELAPRWQALAGSGEGLCLWHYRGGPWELAARFPCRGRVL